jgi:hypothetical protein
MLTLIRSNYSTLVYNFHRNISLWSSLYPAGPAGELPSSHQLCHLCWSRAVVDKPVICTRYKYIIARVQQWNSCHEASLYVMCLLAQSVMIFLPTECHMRATHWNDIPVRYPCEFDGKFRHTFKGVPIPNINKSSYTILMNLNGQDRYRTKISESKCRLLTEMKMDEIDVLLEHFSRKSLKRF